MTREELVDELRDALSDACDMDVTFGDYAEAAVRCLEKNGVFREWQPIETAPLDKETHILLLTTNHGAVEAWFSPGQWHDYHEGREYDGPVWVCADDAFQIEIEELPQEYGGYHHGTATHWMPLPPPPEDI